MKSLHIMTAILAIGIEQSWVSYCFMAPILTSSNINHGSNEFHNATASNNIDNILSVTITQTSIAFQRSILRAKPTSFRVKEKLSDRWWFPAIAMVVKLIHSTPSGGTMSIYTRETNEILKNIDRDCIMIHCEGNAKCWERIFPKEIRSTLRDVRLCVRICLVLFVLETDKTLESSVFRNFLKVGEFAQFYDKLPFVSYKSTSYLTTSVKWYVEAKRWDNGSLLLQSILFSRTCDW